MKVKTNHINLRFGLSLILMILILGGNLSSIAQAQTKSNRTERRLITKGNKLYTDRKFKEAEKTYKEALNSNAYSAAAKYNLGLSQIRQVSNPADTTQQTKAMLDQARANLTEVAAMSKLRPGLAAKANYNLGNLEFNTKDYQKAIDYYKQALRIDPNDNHARRNLRIAQKQLDDQNKNKNQDQKKDQNKDQEKNKDQEQNKDQQDQNQQNQDQQNQDQQNQDQQKNNEVSSQSASRILQNVENRENQTRARFNKVKASKSNKAVGAGANRKKW